LRELVERQTAPGVPDLLLGQPKNYLHVALQEVRRTDILWSGEEIQAYERLKKAAQANSHPIPEYIKKIVNKHLTGT
jgi:phenylpyruvate tautomerase PptA (4-oxalocrotonate tautomerase family)